MSKCLRCNHTWTKRTEGKPVQCPVCKSPAWDKPRKVNSKLTESGARQALNPPDRLDPNGPENLP